MRRKSACVITAGSIATCPRLVKCAAALADVGFDVYVVSTNLGGDWSAFEQKLRDDQRWRWHGVDASPGLRRMRSGIRKAWRAFAKTGAWRAASVAQRATQAMAPLLARVAMNNRADIYIGFGAGSLAIAATAAAANDVRAAYDAEDFHVGELLPEQQDSV